MAEQMEGIKRRIKSINSTERITNAMKLVSASKLRKAKAAYESSQRYLNHLIESIQETFNHIEDVPTQYLAGSRDIKTVCFVVITSSNGLCGSFNVNVLKALEKKIQQAEEKGQKVKLFLIGSKGRDYAMRRGYDILAAQDIAADSMTVEQIREDSNSLFALYQDEKIDEIEIIYTSYINTLKQEVVVKKMLPFDADKIVSDGKYHMEIEYGPSVQEVFEYLVPKYVELSIFGMAIESATCEHAARRTAMENANDNAKDMLDILQMEYNRARQAEITDEIIEIVAGAEAQH